MWTLLSVNNQVFLFFSHSVYIIMFIFRDENHRTPVHLAAIMNQSETIHWLLEYGADVDLPDIHGFIFMI